MRDVLRFARRVAESEATAILREGESGTGKDPLAQMIHQQSHRRAEPFIAINCAAIPETLLESELFGYGKGAFTDARTQNKGVLELAHRGTLFLDEVADYRAFYSTNETLTSVGGAEFSPLGGTKRDSIRPSCRGRYEQESPRGDRSRGLSTGPLFPCECHCHYFSCAARQAGRYYAPGELFR
jgi:DNA-binding NtrC family response regulator